jgi:hypothetical protein
MLSMCGVGDYSNPPNVHLCSFCVAFAVCSMGMWVHVVAYGTGSGELGNGGFIFLYICIVCTLIRSKEDTPACDIIRWCFQLRLRGAAGEGGGECFAFILRVCCVVFLGKVLGTTCVCGGLGVVGVWSRVCVCVGGGGVSVLF